MPRLAEPRLDLPRMIQEVRISALSFGESGEVALPPGRFLHARMVDEDAAMIAAFEVNYTEDALGCHLIVLTAGEDVYPNYLFLGGADSCDSDTGADMYYLYVAL